MGSCENHVGTPHTTKVGRTFPIVKLRFKCNKPQFEPCAKKTCVYFFYFFEFPRESSRDHLGETVRGDLDPAPP